MAIPILQSLEIIETMENYLAAVRPPVEIRPKLDIGYELTNQSVVLNQIRPFWANPEQIMTHGYAKPRTLSLKINGKFIGNEPMVSGTAMTRNPRWRN